MHEALKSSAPTEEELSAKAVARGLELRRRFEAMGRGEICCPDYDNEKLHSPTRWRCRACKTDSDLIPCPAKAEEALERHLIHECCERLKPPSPEVVARKVLGKALVAVWNRLRGPVGSANWDTANKASKAILAVQDSVIAAALDELNETSAAAWAVVQGTPKESTDV